MKMAYVTTYDSSNVRRWSGLGKYILMSLRDAGLDAETVGNVRERKITLVLSLLKRFYYTCFSSHGYLRDREPSVLMDYSAYVENALKSMEYDIVFSPGTVAISYLRSEKPIVFWADAAFAGMLDFYPNFTRLCSETINNGHKMEQSALSRCRLAIYASEWAANSALQHYDVDPAKVKVVPFGANIPCERNANDIDRLVENKRYDVCKLLFLGVNWHRKGGEKALEVATRLNRMGLKTELHIAGCDPPSGLPEFVKHHGFISKNTVKGLKRLEKLFSDSHFLILPSKAECYGVVFAEASSFGLPSLATNVGGIPTAVTNGRNGWTFDPDESPESYCGYIEKYMSSKHDYKELALSSFRQYKERLNWKIAGRQVRALVNEFCG